MPISFELTGDNKLDRILSTISSVLNRHEVEIRNSAKLESVQNIVKMLDSRLSYLQIRQGIEEPKNIPVNTMILYSDKNNGNEWRIKCHDGSIYAVVLNPISGGAV